MRRSRDRACCRFSETPPTGVGLTENCGFREAGRKPEKLEPGRRRLRGDICDIAGEWTGGERST